MFEEFQEELQGGGFEDVEGFLSEHKVAVESDPDDPPFTEPKTAEALAVSWGERRKEIAKMRQSRQLGSCAHGSMKDRRSFSGDRRDETQNGLQSLR